MILNRRRFLSALGLTGATTAVLPSMLTRRALAGSTAPKRLIILSTAHGTVYDGWKMRQGSEDDGRAWEFDLAGMDADEFSHALQPLHEHRSRLLVQDGLAMISAEKDIPGYRHEKGWIHAWTGGQVYFTGSDLFATTPSLDQIVAAELARADRLPSLELGIGDYRPISHAGLAQQLPMETDPARVFDRIFGLSTSTDPLIKAQDSVLDFARAEHDAISSRLSSSDRERLLTHYELVRQLEQRIAGLSAAECSHGIDRTALASTAAGYTELFISMTELIAAAFSCDMTRVVSLSLGDLPSEDFGWGDYLSGDAHNDFAHRIFADQSAADAMTDYTRMHAEQLAYLIGVLESIPDAGGGSLMDSTLIVWASEMGDGWHGYDRHCCLTVGGSWHFRPGRYLHYPDDTDVAIYSGRLGGEQSTCGKPHQHLLISVANAMGVDIDSVGDTEVTNRAGTRVSLTGALEGMT